MRIRGGYGKKIVEENIKEYIDHGYSEEKATTISKKLSRKWFVKKFPDRPLPEYLLEVNYENKVAVEEDA